MSLFCACRGRSLKVFFALGNALALVIRPPNKYLLRMPLELTTPDWKNAWFDQRLAERLTQEMGLLSRAVTPALSTVEQWLTQCNVEVGRLAQAVQTLNAKEGQVQNSAAVTARHALRLSAIALLLTAALDGQAQEQRHTRQAIMRNAGQKLAPPAFSASRSDRPAQVEADKIPNAANHSVAQWLTLQGKRSGDLPRPQSKRLGGQQSAPADEVSPPLRGEGLNALGELMVGEKGKMIASESSLRQTAQAMYADGLSAREIAAVLDCEDGWVREVLKTSRSTLKGQLDI